MDGHNEVNIIIHDFQGMEIKLINLTLLQIAQTQVRQRVYRCLIRVYSLCLRKCVISDPTLVDLRNDIFSMCPHERLFYKFS